jgi:hypothetical protein
VAIDHATKWPIAVATRSCSAETVADFIKTEIMLKFGCPSEVTSDRGSAFRDATLKLYLEDMRVKHNMTSPYHPRSNGATERFNGLLGKVIQKYCSTGNRNKWEEYLDQALLACRIRAHRATGYSPFYLVYGQSPRILGENLVPSIGELDETDMTGPRLSQLEKLKEIRTTTKQNLQRQKDKIIEYSKKQMRQGKRQLLQRGSYVLIRNEAKQKFEPNWLGPLVIDQVLPNGLFEIKSLQGQKYGTRIHRDRLKLAKVLAVKKIWCNPKRFDTRSFKRRGM